MSEKNNDRSKSHQYSIKAEAGVYSISGGTITMRHVKADPRPIANTAQIIAETVAAPQVGTVFEYSSTPATPTSQGTEKHETLVSSTFKWTLIAVVGIAMVALAIAVCMNLFIAAPSETQQTFMSLLYTLITTCVGAVCGLLGGKQL